MVKPSFLNLPIWANFVDPTDLSLYLPTTTTTYFRPANIILQPQPQPQPQPAEQVEDQAGQVAQVEDS